MEEGLTLIVNIDLWWQQVNTKWLVTTAHSEKHSKCITRIDVRTVKKYLYFIEHAQPLIICKYPYSVFMFGCQNSNLCFCTLFSWHGTGSARQPFSPPQQRLGGGSSPLPAPWHVPVGSSNSKPSLPPPRRHSGVGEPTE